MCRWEHVKLKFQNLAIARWMARLTTWNQEDSDEEGPREPVTTWAWMSWWISIWGHIGRMIAARMSWVSWMTLIWLPCRLDILCMYTHIYIFTINYIMYKGVFTLNRHIRLTSMCYVYILSFKFVYDSTSVLSVLFNFLLWVWYSKKKNYNFPFFHEKSPNSLTPSGWIPMGIQCWDEKPSPSELSPMQLLSPQAW